MTPELHAMLTGWLESGTDLQKAHAAHRLSLPDAVDFVPPTPAPIEAPAYPPILEQAGNLARALAGFAADGFATVDDDERARRLAICAGGCPHYDAGPGRCVLCGCYASFKARVASQHCPDDPPRW